MGQILVMENDCVRMLDVQFKPGEKTGMHTHPDHVVYVFNDGKFKLPPSKGKIQELISKPGKHSGLMPHLIPLKIWEKLMYIYWFLN